MRYVDFHCHLDLFPDFEALVSGLDRAGIRTVAVTTTPKAWPRNRELASGTRHVRAALGLHPQLAAERSAEMEVFEAYLPEARFVGEVGLDAGPRFYKALGIQKQVFERILRLCAREGDKVLSVHSVRATTVVLDMLEALLPPSRGRVILHWFSGSRSEARRAVGMGCFFSVNKEMLLKDRARDIIASLPLDCLLTETDGPFTEQDGRASRPTDVPGTIEALASLRALSPESMAAAIHSNAQSLW